jgi:hypothetical protein
LVVWARASERTTFSITLHDLANNTRTYWDLGTYGSSIDTQWKRFAIDLNNYTVQTSNFDLAKIKFIDFYVSSNQGRSMSLWIDDLVVDDLPLVNGAIYKTRVLTADVVAAYFSFTIAPSSTS